MIEIGCHLSSEEFNAEQLVAQARWAEEAGFSFITIADHFHPWTTRQGQSPFVWSTLGAISQVTSRLRVGTAVTCPLIRIHPAIIAQAAATTASLLHGRFFLGVGTGEKLNEHVTGEAWPEPGERWEMLEEAIKVLRLLWEPGPHSFEGRFYHVDDAQIFTLPEAPPPIFVAANVKKSATLAGKSGDGLIAVAPKKDLLSAFRASGGEGKPCLGNITVCHASSQEQAQRIAFETWPTSGLPSSEHWELPTPAAFEAAVREHRVTEAQVAKKIVCGPRVADHVEAIEKYVAAGFTQVGVKQCGPDQQGFYRFYREQVLPALVSKKLVAAV